jgi:hypothetical protein
MMPVQHFFSRQNDTGIIGPVKGCVPALFALGIALASPQAAHAQSAEPVRCRGADGYMQTDVGVRTYIWRPEWLVSQRAAVRRDRRLTARWREAAEEALSRPQRSVMDKTALPASGDRHDYYSVAPYWWPNPDTANGLPYVRRDGEVNPARDGAAYDQTALQQVSRDIRTLALAYDHLGDRRYAERAAALVRLWFLDPATRMNPNFTHAQAIPGANAGRAEGIIEAIALPDVIESVGVIERAGVLSEAEHAALRRWFMQLVQWLATSENGREERSAANNHGVYYDYFFAHFALYARLEPLVVDTVNRFPAQRIAPQMAADGSFPLELERTRPFHYSMFTLDAAGRLAALGACVNRDLWNARTQNGRSLAMGMGWIAPFVVQSNEWRRADLDLADPPRRGRTLAAAVQILRSYQWGGLVRDVRVPDSGEHRVGELIIPAFAQQ